MGFNSKICTTLEQSERLLALGLKKETADCNIMLTIRGETYNSGFDLCRYEYIHNGCYHPAWSLHRLMQIYEYPCILSDDLYGNPFEVMINRIANKIKWGELNKEYLEE